MNVHQPAQLSGLAFVSVDASSQEEPKWRTSEWPPLVGRHRHGFASVVVNHPVQTQEQTVVVLGGYERWCWTYNGYSTNSTFRLNVDDDTKVWQAGPSMNEARAYHAAVVCNGAVYAIGGQNENAELLDTIEKIDVSDLLCPSSYEGIEKNKWTTLDCRLSSKRCYLAAVAVHERFIVVAGGYHGIELSSVNILDTLSSESQCVMFCRNKLNIRRSGPGMAVIGQRIYVLGGQLGKEYLNSVEYLEFHDWMGEEPKSQTSTMAMVSKNFWTIHKDLVLDTPRVNPGVVKMGPCLVVVGGVETLDPVKCSRSVEIMDTHRNIVSHLPALRLGRDGCGVVAVSSGIVTIGVYEYEDSGETLCLTDKNSLCFAGLMALGKAPVRPELC